METLKRGKRGGKREESRQCYLRTEQGNASRFRCSSNLTLGHLLAKKGGFPFDLYYFGMLPPGNHSNELLSQLRARGILAPNVQPNPDGSIPLANVPPGTYASRLFGTREEIAARVTEELGHTVANLGEGPTIYLMHRDDNDYISFNGVPRKQTAVGTIVNALNSEPKIASNVAILGVSNWKPERILSPWLQFNSPYFSLFEMNATRSIHAGGIQVTHEDMTNEAFLPGVFLNPYSPLGGWSIMDQPGPSVWNSSRALAEAHRADPYWGNVVNAIFTEANTKRFLRLQQFTAVWNAKHQTSASLDQLALAYVLAHARMQFSTIGPITVDELKRCVQSLQIAETLSSSDLAWLHHGSN